MIITTRSSQVGISYPIQILKLREMSYSLQILSNDFRREGLRSGKDAHEILVLLL
jgi:hypothetical protein